MAVPRGSQEDSTITSINQKTQPPAPALNHVPNREKEIQDPDIERVLSASTTNPTGNEKDHMNYNRVDAELAKYANAVAVDISPEENARLKRLIDRRVLPVMIFTYFLQALDKGTMSFTGIMGIRDDIPVLKDNSKVRAGRTLLLPCVIVIRAWERGKERKEKKRKEGKEESLQ